MTETKPGAPRMLLINPNTSTDITGLLEIQAHSLVGGTVEIRAVTARFGARYIASRAAEAIAGHAALDAYAEHGDGCDGALLACFGDPGLLALREVAPIPVVGMAEASCRLACRDGGRFSIVTGGSAWRPMLEEFVALLGLGPQLASIRTVEVTGGEVRRNPAYATALLVEAAARCATEDRADIVVLGGAGFAGLARQIEPHVPVPVICSLEASIWATVEAMARGITDGEGSVRSNPGPVETIGLSQSLGRTLAAGSETYPLAAPT